MRLLPHLLGALFLLIAPNAPSTSFAQTQTAQYQVVFEATWSATTHPNLFPNNAHFSPLVGGNHDGQVVFWEPGVLASLGIERMAETGNTSVLAGEINAEITPGFAEQSFVGSGLNSPGSTTLTFTMDRDYPLVTLVSMLAPSPDWFVGVHGLPLFDQGWWVPEVQVDLLTYDSGTDHGPSFTSPNNDANPAEPIALQGFPLEPGLPVGTMTFTRLPEPASALQLLAGAASLAFWGRRRGLPAAR